MKYLLSLFITSFFTLLVSAQNSSIHDIMIVKEPTSFLERNGELVFRTMVSHTDFIGNDDDAHNIVIKVEYPEALSLCKPPLVKSHDWTTHITTSVEGQVLTINVGQLPRRDHIDIDVYFHKVLLDSIEYAFRVEALSASHEDGNLSNNCLEANYKLGRTPDHRTYCTPFISNTPGLNILDWCYINNLCFKCKDNNILCAGDRLKLPSINALRRYGLVKDGKLIAKSEGDNTGQWIVIPKDINEKNYQSYAVIKLKN